MGNNHLLVSVLMSTYNEDNTVLSEAINSILNQTHSNLEFIIINDNPDNIDMINFLSNIDDSRVKVFFNEKNIGLVKSLNKGLKLCNGQFIARMDADDISLETRLEEQLNYLIINNCDLIGCAVERIDDLGNNLNIKDCVVVGSKKINESLSYYNTIIHPTFFMKNDVINSKEINGYRDVYSVEDYDLVCRLVNKGYKLNNLDKVLMKCRVRADGISKKTEYIQYRMFRYVSHLYKNNNLEKLDNDKQLTMIKNDKISEQKYYNSLDIKNKYSKKNIAMRVYGLILSSLKSKYQRERILNYLIVKVYFR